MPLAALQEEDDEEETQEMTEVLAAAEEISMETLTSVPGGVFMLKGKEKIAPNVFSVCHNMSSRV